MDGARVGPDGVARCWWCGDDPLYTGYHDTEWGRPVGDDVALFEKLCLEGFQAGLSWLTILRKREAFRRAFRGFVPEEVARFGPREVGRLMSDASIVRNRAKIEATINNARRAGALREEQGSLAAYLWSFEPRARPRGAGEALPAEATALSKDLKRRGWRFVGPTTVHSFMQAMGLVNEHVAGCAARRVCERERAAFQRPSAG